MKKKPRRRSRAADLRDIAFMWSQADILRRLEEGKVTQEFFSKAAEATIEAGQSAWKRIKGSSRQRQSYFDWAAVSVALELGEAHCRELAGGMTKGGTYSRLIGTWLRLHDFNDITPAVRSWLREIRNNQTPIDAWRNSLPLEQRIRLNHPRTILEHWKASWSSGEKEQAANNRMGIK